MRLCYLCCACCLEIKHLDAIVFVKFDDGSFGAAPLSVTEIAAVSNPLAFAPQSVHPENSHIEDLLHGVFDFWFGGAWMNAEGVNALLKQTVRLLAQDG